MDQRHWQEESELARAADDMEPGLKLENVAAHSWHVADTIMLLAPNFPEVNAQRALELAVLHDKLELFTGDYDPVGPLGDGTKSHAFDEQAQAAKTATELAALDQYVAQLRPGIRDWQRELILETIHANSLEAQLVKAVDKLQALTFVLAKKAGAMTDEHLTFSLRYSWKAVEYFPKLLAHHEALVRRLVLMVAEYRRVAPADVLSRLPSSVRPIAAAES
jgi:5'-deoxynucleotidase YfbR-like HD superfamily hydrolase